MVVHHVVVHHKELRARARAVALAAVPLTAVALALAGCAVSSLSSAPGPVQSAATAPQSGPSGARRPGHLAVVHDPGQVTGTLTGSCQARDDGRLPDRHCTPGAIDPAVTQADLQTTICVSGYTAKVRPPESQTGKFKFTGAYPAYHMASGTESELDHLVPLELGGANDATNLWPEAGSVPNPKDSVERALNRAVCDGRIPLSRAQHAIARNWETAESRLGLTS